MIPELEPVALQELRALGSPKTWEFEGHLDALPSLTPVRGEIRLNIAAMCLLLKQSSAQS